MMLVDKENGKGYVEMEKVHRDKKEYASKAVGGTALGLSIGALGLQLLGGGLLNGGLFGNRAAIAETAAIAGTAANEQYLERKQCADHVQFVNDMWRTSYMQQNQRFEDRQTINQEMFGIYSAMRNGFDVINAAANKNAFDLYKYSRDNKDELMGQIGEMKTELAVLKATRPYQDALIQCDIRRVAEHADFNLWRRTCRMISGEVVLPNTPTVTGYASYNPCACPATTPAPTTAA